MNTLIMFFFNCYYTHTPTMDRLPPGVDSVAVCEVDHIFNAVAV